MARFIIERVHTTSEFRIGCGECYLAICNSKRLSLSVICGMLRFVQAFRDPKDKPADQLLASLFHGAEKAVVQMALNKLAAERLVGGDR